MPLYFLITSTLPRHPGNIRFTMEKEAYHKLPFLDVLANNNDPNSFLTSVYHKKTFTGLLTNYFSFTSYSYKVGQVLSGLSLIEPIRLTTPGRGYTRTSLNLWIS